MASPAGDCPWTDASGQVLEPTLNDYVRVVLRALPTIAGLAAGTVRRRRPCPGVEYLHDSRQAVAAVAYILPT